ncbi:hypothetical protein ACWOFR_12015 [Carnobacterium gallinarum]
MVNGAVLAIGAALPWKIAMGLGLVSGSVNSYESISGNTIGGRKLSGKERILRGVFGTLDLALAGYSGVKGFKNRGSKVPEVPEKAGGTNPSKIKRTQTDLDDLARDPSHSGNITKGSELEREIGLALEERGDLGHIVRDKTANGGAEFIDTVTGKKIRC